VEEGHYVYVLYADSFDKIYIGYSSDPEKRLISHNADFNYGWTRKYRPWRLIYIEKLSNKKKGFAKRKATKISQGQEVHKRRNH